MPIKVQCACGKAFAAKDELAGRTVKCPSCQQPLKIPGAAPGKPPAKPGAPAPAAKPAATKPAATKPAAAKPSAAKPAATAKPAAAPRPAPAPTSGDSLFDEIGLQAATEGTRPCPGCTQPLPINAVICVKCGYNARIGRRMETVRVGSEAGVGGHGAVAQDLLDRAAQVMEEDVAEDKKKTGEGLPWWVYLIGLCMLIAFATMMLLLPLRSAMLAAGVMLYCTAAVVSLYANIRLIILAFSESILQGVLYLFVPLYSLVYIFTRWDRCSSFFLLLLGAGVIGGAAMGISMIAANMESKPAEQHSSLDQRQLLVENASAGWHSPQLLVEKS
jgi:hypothetical protein